MNGQAKSLDEKARVARKYLEMKAKEPRTSIWPQPPLCLPILQAR